MRLLRSLCLLAAATVALGGCETVDDERIPWAEVRISFRSAGEWNLYGVPGAGSWRRFVKSERIPADFPYTALTYTGFGGVLLVCDYLGNPMAYDLACPVELKYDVRVEVDPESLLAECPVCHSRYYIFENYGAPFSGLAAERHYGLKRYYVSPAGDDYMTVHN